jgi:DNA-binding NtrC family response regulator
VTAPRFDNAAIKLLREYHWPGNIRELRNLAERMVILRRGRNVGSESLPAEIRAERATLHRASAGGFTLPPEAIVMERLEANIIRRALARTAGNRSRAARLLGISRDTLLYRLKKHAIV